MKCFIGCSSYDDIDPKHFKTAKSICEKLISRNYDLVFGCCNKGLMGTVYNEFKKSNSNITAVCTEFYKQDLENVDCNKVLVKSTLDQIQEFMKSDLLVFLPGGYGTYNELFYLINAYVTKDHNSKIIVINFDNYYDDFKNILETIKKEKFAKVFDIVEVVDNIEDFDKLLEI